MNKIIFSLYLIVVSVIAFGAIELGVRYLYPDIFFQGTAESLFQANKFNDSAGYKNNSSGDVFGVTAYTDELGFRKMESPAEYEKAWLFLGDSVTFGMGAETKHIFPQLIQNNYPEIKIFNSASVGHSSIDHFNVADVFLKDHKNIEKVVLFFCLNDIYGKLTLEPVDLPLKEQVLSYLRTHSKFYLLLKRVLLDRSKAQAIPDLELYTEDNHEMREHLNKIVQISSKLKESNIEFSVYISPYEYQLREPGRTKPQEIITKHLEEHGIKVIDLYEDFSTAESPPEAYFLPGDPMHFSNLGHQLVTKRVLEEFSK